MADPASTPVDALIPAMTLLAAGGAAALVCKALRLSPIVGYLAVGILIGPDAFHLIQESSTTHLLAELGVVFLLFDIGLHVSLRELRESGRDLMGLAPSHLVLTSFPFTIALMLFGLDWPVALALGLSFGLSSTAVVSRVMSERGLGSCPLGRSSTHVLIFQDIVAIFLLIFATSISSGGDASALALTLARAAGLAVLAFIVAFAAGHFLMGPVFRSLAQTRNQEAFTAVTLLLVLGAASATAQLGLSLTLGAFLAGLAVSGTSFRHQIQMETGPFRGLLLSFFFMSVGLSVDLDVLASQWPLVIAIALSILLIKTVFGFAAARLNKWSNPGSVQLTFLLAQGSEFTLVVLSILTSVTGMVPPFVATISVAAVALSLAVAPFWAAGGMKLSRKVASLFAGQTRPDNEITPISPDRPVIIFGMTPSGRLTADALSDHDIPHVCLDAEPDRFVSAIADGYTVSFGNAANLRLVEAIAGPNPRAVVIGAPRYDVSRDLTPAAQREFPNTPRFVAVDNEADRQRFSDLGMRAWLSMGKPVGIEMAADVLRQLGIEEKQVAEWVSREADRFDVKEPMPETSETLETEAA
ncbi:cation:proton antiporter domain-containing protein [Henriciella pelagia]|jgi:Kef-type K+ transport system membrane component KefB|uniref:Potassium transporter TrkA n=1 Tax=Henriciella pelagia TaxID=1977912 RepID=A0ABQ1JDY1_9PROT|nr:cation:proton antiporter [Henriciella pelagia]GGB66104.1 potassium transporter TrkA [Henriciella pelagia]